MTIADDVGWAARAAGTVWISDFMAGDKAVPREFVKRADEEGRDLLESLIELGTEMAIKRDEIRPNTDHRLHRFCASA